MKWKFHPNSRSKCEIGYTLARVEIESLFVFYVFTSIFNLFSHKLEAD